MLAMAAGDLATVSAEAEAGISLAEAVDDHASLARCLAMSALSLFFTDFEACERAAVRATEVGVLGGDEFARDWACVMHAYALVTRGHNDEADQVAHGVVVRARRRRDRFCGGFALCVGVYTQLTRGRVAEAVRVGHQSLDLIRPLGDYFGSGTVAANTAHAVAVSGDLEGAAQLMEPVVHSLATPAADAVGFMVPLGLINLWRGDLDESIRWFRAGVARLEQRRADWTAARCIPGLVGALRRKGDLEQAAVWAERGIELLTAFAAPFELADLLDERARVEPEDLGRARELHLQSLVVRRDHGIRLGTAASLEGLARVEAASGDLEQAVYLDAAAQQARSSMGHPRPRVDEEERGAFLAGLPPAAEQPILEERRREGEAVDLDALVTTLTRGRGPRRMTGGALGALTAAEIEVANLVSDGLTNVEIAAQLIMSRGTVKAHLSHVYTKLGVPNRAALAAFVRTHRG
jgi:ATP/maltotriose-dependent transcriptional regulator MalT